MTIARNEGSLGDEITQELSRRLGWHVFDSEILIYVAKNSHVREKLVERPAAKGQKYGQIPSYGTLWHVRLACREHELGAHQNQSQSSILPSRRESDEANTQLIHEEELRAVSDHDPRAATWRTRGLRSN